MPEDLEVPATFRNLDMSLRVILNETRVLRQTMEDVERQMAVLQGEMADVRRALHEQPWPTGRASSPTPRNDEREATSTPSLEPDTAPREDHRSEIVPAEGALGRNRPNQAGMPAGDYEQEAGSEPCRCGERGEAVCKQRYPLGPATMWRAPMDSGRT